MFLILLLENENYQRRIMTNLISSSVIQIFSKLLRVTCQLELINLQVQVLLCWPYFIQIFSNQDWIHWECFLLSILKMNLMSMLDNQSLNTGKFWNLWSIRLLSFHTSIFLQGFFKLTNNFDNLLRCWLALNISTSATWILVALSLKVTKKIMLE